MRGQWRMGCCVEGDCTEETCMVLPDGLACEDCLWVFKCLTMGYTNSATSERCDFFPRRFQKRSDHDN